MMAAVDGFVYQVAFNNPYREPPDGLPRVLAEMFVLRSERGAGSWVPAEIAAFPAPYGFSIHITHVGPPTRSQPPERRAKIRQQRLAARNERKAPLFAETFTAEEIARKPGYYVEGVSEADAAYEAAVARERAVYERLLREHGKLVVYGAADGGCDGQG